MSTTYPDIRQQVDTERIVMELRSIINRFLPGFELVPLALVRQKRQRDIRQARPMRSLSGRPWANDQLEEQSSDQVSAFYIRTGTNTYRVYVRPVGADDPPKAVHLSTAKKCILSLQG